MTSTKPQVRFSTNKQTVFSSQLTVFLYAFFTFCFVNTCVLSAIGYATDFSGSLNSVTITDLGGTNAPPTAVINFIQNGDTIDFDASGSTDSDGSVVEYRWNFGDGSTGIGVVSSHSFSLTEEVPVTLSVIDNAGGVAVTQVVIQFSPPQAINFRIATGDDDVEESKYGEVTLSSSDLELVEDGGAQAIGLRFTGISIPKQSNIINAYVEFETDETGTGTTTLDIFIEDSANSLPFASSKYNISDRSVIASTVTWANVDDWNILSEKHQTPDIAALIQTIVNLQDWNAGNAISIIISGTGKRTAESFEGKSGAAPLLHVVYQ